VLNRTKLVDATIKTVRKNLLEGAALVVVVLLLLLGNVRAALICALAIPLAMLMTATGMVQNRVSGNLMSLGAIDFGLIVDGAVIIVENCLRRLAESQHHKGRVLTLPERLHEVSVATKEMIQPSFYGQAIIVTVYFPILALTGIEGKMFHPMALTVIFALVGAFILSLTFVPAMVAILIRGRVTEREMFLIRWAKTPMRPSCCSLSACAGRSSLSRWLRSWDRSCSLAAWGRSSSQPWMRKTWRCTRCASHPHPSRSRRPCSLMWSVRSRPSRKLPFVYSKTGTAEMATDPMPPNVSDTFIIFKPRDQWRSEAELDRLIAAQDAENDKIGSRAGHDEHAHAGPRIEGHKGKLVRLIELTVATVPGNNYEFTQPIQMRFNELISGSEGMWR
jgi:cobalt-zinc-cadmium resistance protein CzcA